MRGALVALALVACASGPPATPLRFVTATTAELEAAAAADTTWFELREGDEVPLTLLFAGMLEGGAEALRLRAKTTFWVVLRRGKPPRLSFDGRTLHGGTLAESLLRLGPGDDGRPEAVFVIVAGPEETRRGALRQLQSP
ncbi:MAG: hypothetical protein AAGH15_15800 [Myxococcota bacterium]